MRADERQAGAAYTYAWWLTGDDDAAVRALEAAFARLADSAERDASALTVLMQGVRAHLGDLRPMCPASELALLHDGLDVELDAAAELAAIPAGDVTVQLAHGRLEGLLETVREDFDHPERLGGLAVGTPADIAHARQCPSCARVRTLVERGRNELREVVGVSAPPGLLAGLVAGTRGAAPPAPPPARPAPAPEAPPADEVVEAPAPAPAPPAAPPVPEPEALAPDVEAPAPPAQADTTELEELQDLEELEDLEELDELGPPTGDELMQPPALLRPKPPPRQVPTTPARKRAAGVLAGVGILVAFGTVTALFAMGDQGRVPAPAGQQPAVDAPTPGGDTGSDAGGGTETQPPGFGPDTEDGGGFTIADAGLLRSGEDEFAPQGGDVAPDEPLRLAVDYRNAVEGVTINAVWRVDGKRYLRLSAVLSGSSSRHVWGLPVPPDGWPVGAHRVLITTEDGLAAAIDFHVRAQA